MQQGVYFIQADIGGPIKIGYSSDVPKRIQEIQFMCPFKLVLLAIIPDAEYTIEARLHERFKKDRLHGEWFTPSPEVQNFIANVQYKYGDTI